MLWGNKAAEVSKTQKILIWTIQTRHFFYEQNFPSVFDEKRLSYQFRYYVYFSTQMKYILHGVTHCVNQSLGTLRSQNLLELKYKAAQF